MLNLGACKFITGPVYKKKRVGEKRSLKATSKRALKSNFTNTTPSTNPWDFFFFWLEEIQNSPAAHSFCQQTWSSEMLRISVENFLFLVIFGSLWLLGFHCVPNSLHFPSMHLPVCVSSPLSFSLLCVFYFFKQAGMALYKIVPKNPYYFWSVMSLVMQVCAFNIQVSHDVCAVWKFSYVLPLCFRPFQPRTRSSPRQCSCLSLSAW